MTTQSPAPWLIRASARLRALGVTQQDLVQPLKVRTRGAVGHYLTGRREMSPEQLRALAKACKWTLDELMGTANKTTEAPATVTAASGTTSHSSNTQEDGTVMIEITHQGERQADDIELLRKMVRLWAGASGAAASAVVIRRGGELIPPITQVRRRGGKPADPVHEVASRGGNLTERDDKNL